MDQCHLRMCQRTVVWTSNITYVCHRAEGVKGYIGFGRLMVILSLGTYVIH